MEGGKRRKIGDSDQFRRAPALFRRHLLRGALDLRNFCILQSEIPNCEARAWRKK